MSSGNGYKNLGKVLVLNATQVPINICTWKRAMSLLFKNKAESLVKSKRLINQKYILPSIIKLMNYVPIPYNGVVLSRKNIYLRDNHTCQYCGKHGTTLTIDHILPKTKGGTDKWENVVVSCVRCNNRKGDRTPEKAGMKLLSMPYKPPSSLYLQLTRYNNVPDSWYDYFFRKAKN